MEVGAIDNYTRPTPCINQDRCRQTGPGANLKMVAQLLATFPRSLVDVGTFEERTTSTLCKWGTTGSNGASPSPIQLPCTSLWPMQCHVRASHSPPTSLTTQVHWPQTLHFGFRQMRKHVGRRATIWSTFLAAPLWSTFKFSHRSGYLSRPPVLIQSLRAICEEGFRKIDLHGIDKDVNF